MKDLAIIWQELVAKYSNNNQLANALWNEIETSYTAKNRHYHNLTHLGYMIDQSAKHQDNLSDSDTVLFSIFYHDIVYNVRRKNNEQKSAEIAQDRLTQLNVSADKIAKCQTQILATKTHQESSDADTNYLVDFDLAILGESPATYREYTEKIRSEYAVFPDFLYNRGRRKVLQHFLAMNRIFKTTTFYENYEQPARDNLMSELQSLK